MSSHNNTDPMLWIIIFLLAGLIAVTALLAGRDITSLQRRVGQLEQVCK